MNFPPESPNHRARERSGARGSELPVEAETRVALEERACRALDHGNLSVAGQIVAMLEVFEPNRLALKSYRVRLLLAEGFSTQAAAVLDELERVHPEAVETRLARAEWECATGRWQAGAQTIASLLARLETESASLVGRRARSLAREARAAFEDSR